MRFVPRTRHIPANSTRIERAVGVVYAYTVGAEKKLAAIAYAGKSNKAAFHNLFRTQAQLDARIAEFFEGLEAHQRRVAERRVEISQPHTVKVDAVIYNSWGYDQTNIDFYQVVRISANFVWLQSIDSKSTPDGGCGPMSGHVEPVAGTMKGAVTKHRATMYNGTPSINFKHGAGRLYDGQPKYESWYA
jgi:hypothetical protein